MLNEGDHDGQGEQAVHQVDDLVDLRRLSVDVLGPALQVGVRVVVADAGDRRLSVCVVDSGAVTTYTEKSNWSTPVARAARG